MATKLERILELSKENPNMKFNSIGHLIDDDMLKVCYIKMDDNKAVGIDGISKEEYECNLNDNLRELVRRLKNKGYRPNQPKELKFQKMIMRR